MKDSSFYLVNAALMSDWLSQSGMFSLCWLRLFNVQRVVQSGLMSLSLEKEF